MRPHTRKQCFDARICLECNPSTFLLTDFSIEILVKIFKFLSYKRINQLRLVSRQFNEICASILNGTFYKLQNRMSQRFQGIREKMPRRESARRNHPLAYESDIVETLHMRLSLLQMTFGKHIERKHVCFFPGEILDEVIKIINNIRGNPNLRWAYNVTDELFDLSSMAMEYFKEKIEPSLPEIVYFGVNFLDFTMPFSNSSGSGSKTNRDSAAESSSSSLESVSGSLCSDHWSNFEEESSRSSLPLPPSNMVLRKRIRKIRIGMRIYNDQLVEVKRELKASKSKMEAQEKTVHEYTLRLEQYDKKFEESSRKFQTLITELNKCKTELQYWRSKSSILSAVANTSTCSKCQEPLNERQESNALETLVDPTFSNFENFRQNRSSEENSNENNSNKKNNGSRPISGDHNSMIKRTKFI